MIHRVRIFWSQTFSYNILNQPSSVSTTSDEADYTYLADGTKAQVLGEQNEDGYAYLGSMVFALREGEWLFDSTPFAGGMIRRASGSWVADRNGNVASEALRCITSPPTTEAPPVPRLTGFSRFSVGGPICPLNLTGFDRFSVRRVCREACRGKSVHHLPGVYLYNSRRTLSERISRRDSVWKLM